MNGELVKRQDRWDLYAEDGSKIGSSAKNPMNKLSLKNCQAIENGYDLDEIRKLADEDFECELGDGPTTNESINSMIKKSNAYGAEWGFQKALEILGDKKFSENKLLVDFVYFLNDRHFNKYMVDTDEVDLYLESLQQTEWDVEIEMEQYVKYVPKSLATVYPTGGVRPKLDSNGCLILKRK